MWGRLNIWNVSYIKMKLDRNLKTKLQYCGYTVAFLINYQPEEVRTCRLCVQLEIVITKKRKEMKTNCSQTKVNIIWSNVNRTHEIDFSSCLELYSYNSSSTFFLLYKYQITRLTLCTNNRKICWSCCWTNMWNCLTLIIFILLSAGYTKT